MKNISIASFPDNASFRGNKSNSFPNLLLYAHYANIYTGVRAGNTITPLSSVSAPGNVAGLTPAETYAIDRKLDDGLPMSGDIWGGNYGDARGANCLDGYGHTVTSANPLPNNYANVTKYNVDLNSKRCAPFLFLK